MKNSAIVALFAEQYCVPKDAVQVEFILFDGEKYEFEVTVCREDIGEIQSLTYFSHCTNFRERMIPA